MSIPKKSESPITARATRSAPAAGEPTTVSVPRGWLIALIALLIVPWLVAGTIYLRDEKAIAAGSEPAPTGEAAASGSAGPWGRLTLTPIVVSPPLEYVAPDWGRTQGAGPWHFPGVSPDVLHSFLSSLGLPRETVDRLQANARPEPAIRGLVIKPDADIVRGLDPEVRARLYSQLGKTTLNFDQSHSFRFHGTSPDAWLNGSLISPRTRALIEPLLYRDGEFLHFADSALVRTEITEDEELQRLAKVLLRQSTLLVSLTVTNVAEVPKLAEYWGRGGRRTDVRPLLESIAGGGSDHSIDIVHLLPAFARNHLYRYPRVTTGDFDKPLLANCLWTVLNFFRDTPDDKFLDVGTALATLKQDYYIVEHGFQLGDIVGFVDNEGDLFHVAVYLADGLVFTKNGMSPVAPWTIMPVDRLSAYYRGRAETPRLIYHRRNDF